MHPACSAFPGFSSHKANTESPARQRPRLKARIRAVRAFGGNAGKQEVRRATLMIFAA